ncbi:hypothetical protein ACFPT7_19340 [Acidicapsa dinghuensis]|uniref:Uncharacterized protein n=1 Tax=Acidicapsa dinghuensis TaxID=2218256 RepID=A0ABW1EJV5_9BACT|nr:hypothetical protein [Acidicapsa dinghuensis]
MKVAIIKMTLAAVDPVEVGSFSLAFLIGIVEDGMQAALRHAVAG